MPNVYVLLYCSLKLFQTFILLKVRIERQFCFVREIQKKISLAWEQQYGSHRDSSSYNNSIFGFATNWRKTKKTVQQKHETKTLYKNKKNIKQKDSSLIDGNGAVVKMSVITLKRISRTLYLSLLRQTFSQSRRRIKPRN
jgi:hypothetical protein